MFLQGNGELFPRLTMGYWGLEVGGRLHRPLYVLSDESDKKNGCLHQLTGAVLMAKACYEPEDAVRV